MDQRGPKKQDQMECLDEGLLLMVLLDLAIILNFTLHTLRSTYVYYIHDMHGGTFLIHFDFQTNLKSPLFDHLLALLVEELLLLGAEVLEEAGVCLHGL